MVYNPLSCAGWGTSMGGWIAGSGCLKARLGFIILFFILAILRKWGGEEIGMDFNLIGACILGMLSYGIVVILIGSFKWAFLVGLILGVIGGYGSGLFFGGGEGGYE